LSKIKKVCILSLSNIGWDSRVLREIDMARQHYQVDVIGYGSWQPPEGVRFFSLARKIVFPPLKYFLLVAGKLNNKCFDCYFWLKPQHKQALEIIMEGEYDLVHANDWDALPVAATAGQKSGCRVLFDAHEYYLADRVDGIFFDKLIIPYRNFLLIKYQNHVSKMITVSEGIEQVYFSKYNWKMSIILNAPVFQKITHHKTEPRNIMLVHHGGAKPGRYLEKILMVLPYLRNEYELHFYLTPSNPKYLKKLKDLANNTVPGRVFFHNPVPPKEIIREISKYDIGIHNLDTKNVNHLNALPNKFFDFMMAGLAVAINPLPVMKKILDEYQLGIILDGNDPQEWANNINSLSVEQIDQYKINSLKAAKILNADVEMNKLHKIYASLL